LVRLRGRFADGAMTVNVAGAWSKDYALLHTAARGLPAS
jgi:hypothetical protein